MLPRRNPRWWHDDTTKGRAKTCMESLSPHILLSRDNMQPKGGVALESRSQLPTRNQLPQQETNQTPCPCA